MAASIGEQLRLAREGRGIGLREICDQTRISVHYLEAIEANDYKRLPAAFSIAVLLRPTPNVLERRARGDRRLHPLLREHGESSDEVNTTPSIRKSTRTHPQHVRGLTWSGDPDSGDSDGGGVGRAALVPETSRSNTRAGSGDKSTQLCIMTSNHDEGLRFVLRSN